MLSHRRPAAAVKVARLQQADTYPESSGPVEVRETHLSWVFLTALHAYKLKKPVRYGGLDLSSPEARRRNCIKEIRLNRRLAPDVYEGLSALTLDGAGRLRLDGDGDPVDWLVRMRRLPADRMLDHLIGQGHLNVCSIRAVARRLAHFYQTAPAVKITPAAYQRRFNTTIQDHRRALSRPSLGLPRGMIEETHGGQLEFLRRDAPLLAQRAAEKRIVEGHGDLRPEHICLEEPPVIFDCLEFSRRLRIVDPVDELAFLAMECRRLGAPGVGAALFLAYGALTEDTPSPRLIAFYQSHRACLWAKLAAWRLAEADRALRPKWRQRAEEYLRLANASIADALS